jgi:expansin (peptidoglycan-binding protein)
MSLFRLPTTVKPHTTLAALTIALVGAVTVTSITSASAATTAIPIGQQITGSMTYYNDAGYGACGTVIDAASQDLVAVSYTWWTTANPNNDPVCQGISVQVTYNGTTITVPVKDKCPSCDSGHIDLSQTAFQKLAPLSVGVVSGITWKFVSST